jgi:hypothetical protein
MNAPRGSRFILETQQEVGVIQQLAVQDFDRHRTVAHRNLLGEEDRTHAACAQAAQLLTVASIILNLDETITKQ